MNNPPYEPGNHAERNSTISPAAARHGALNPEPNAVPDGSTPRTTTSHPHRSWRYDARSVSEALWGRDALAEILRRAPAVDHAPRGASREAPGNHAADAVIPAQGIAHTEKDDPSPPAGFEDRGELTSPSRIQA
ncbi:MAG: hypothetical protein NT045_03900 [Candidatus Aureabacteria bacterium]|nr:hypothetical protein [Candidatus Auribacterota bacterium]